MQSEKINEIAGALAKAQGAMSPAEKDATNPHFKKSYATLASIWDACRKPLADNGLAVIQTIYEYEGQQALETTLAHDSGQFFNSVLVLAAGDGNRGVNAIQAMGSAMTYARRYALAAIVGVSVADDDGNAATNTQSRSASKPHTPNIQPVAPHRPSAQQSPQSDKPKDAMTTYWLEVKARGLKNNGIGAEILAKAKNNPVTAFDMLKEVP